MRFNNIGITYTHAETKARAYTCYCLQRLIANGHHFGIDLTKKKMKIRNRNPLQQKAIPMLI